jgi:chromosome segregation ATPase
MSQNGHPQNPPRSVLNQHPPRQAAANGQESASVQDSWGADALKQEIARLAAGNRELRASVGLPRGGAEAADPTELERLRGENAELRARVEELEHALLDRPQSEEDWGERQREYEALLEEKSEVIRGLHQKLQELREAASAAPRGGPADAGQSQQLANLKRQLEEERAQLEEDAQALETQMRQMEMSMSRERAELARQRTELQRLHNDLRHEMEQAARDAALRERLQPLQRRQQEVASPRRVPTLVEINLPAPAEAPRPETPGGGNKKPGSGLLRRLFGSKSE